MGSEANKNKKLNYSFTIGIEFKAVGAMWGYMVLRLGSILSVALWNDNKHISTCNAMVGKENITIENSS